MGGNSRGGRFRLPYSIRIADRLVCAPFEMRRKIENFSAQSFKNSPSLPKPLIHAESIRDCCIHLLFMVAQQSQIEMDKVLSYPLTMYPLSIA